MSPGRVSVASHLSRRLSRIAGGSDPGFFPVIASELGPRPCEILLARFHCGACFFQPSSSLVPKPHCSSKPDFLWVCLLGAESLVWELNVGSDPLLPGENLSSCDYSPVCGPDLPGASLARTASPLLPPISRWLLFLYL